MSRNPAEVNVLSIYAPISAVVCEMLDTKIIPVIQTMPRREAGAKLGMAPSAVTHYMLSGDARVSMPTLPMIERLAALAGFRTEVSFVRDSSVSETILGAVDPADYEPIRRGRPPLSPEVLAEREAAKPKPKPKAVPTVISVGRKAKAAVEKKTAKAVVEKKTPKAAPKAKAANKAAAASVKKTPKKAPSKATGF